MTIEEFATRLADIFDSKESTGGVSRETISPQLLERLKHYDDVLMDWGARHNLVARSTLPLRWERHFLDSAQLYDLIPVSAKHLVDIGSGAGFPGLVFAAMGFERGLKVTLIESTGKKAAFLQAAATAMDLDNVQVIPSRIENVSVGPVDILSARALASLSKLCAYAHGIAQKNTTLIFPKGGKAQEELTEALKSWRMDVVQRPSATDPSATIFKITNLSPR